jgi:HAD superfamily hydrolase (TIGR01509 family)
MPRESWFDNIDAVIFDLDGTILDSERPIRDAVVEVVAALGFEMPDAFYATLIGVPGPECDLMVREYFGVSFPFDTYFENSNAKIAEALAGGIALKSGVREILAHLQQHATPLAIATSSSRRYVERQLHANALMPFFNTVATRDDVKRGKPHPDLFLKAAADLGIAPERCLALEDSHNGVRAAHAAGCVSIMVPDLLQATDEMRTLCHAIARDLHEVRRLLAQNI